MEELMSVLDNNKLKSGCSWPIPIILQIDKKQVELIGNSKDVLIKNINFNNCDLVLQDVKIEKLNKVSEIAKKWFLTESINHPGVDTLFNSGDYILSCKVKLKGDNRIKRASYQLSPAQVRRIFTEKYYSKIVGFHTRNIPHKGHEFIQKTALKKVDADALFISPVLGNLKSGDFNSNSIIDSYNILIDEKNYEPFDVLLGGINTYSRFSGHREAIFTAICRQNYGCTHFIIGRDHAGIGDYYKDIDIEEYANLFKDLKIKILFFNEVIFDIEKKEYKENTFKNSYDKNFRKISGTICREYIKDNKVPPDYLLSESISKVLIKSSNKFNE